MLKEGDELRDPNTGDTGVIMDLDGRTVTVTWHEHGTKEYDEIDDIKQGDLEHIEK